MISLFAEKLLVLEGLKVIGLTLLHSLWQGLLVATMAALIMAFTKKASAHLRYLLLTTLFVLFLGMVGYTFMRYMYADDVNVFSRIAVQTADTTAVSRGHVLSQILNKFNIYFDLSIPFLVIAWFAIFIVRCIKLLTGLQRMKQMREKNTVAAPGNWDVIIQQLSSRLGINKYIQLLQSEVITTPVTIGFLKPVILVPCSFFTQLPADQAEAVLLHELAHIRRADYLVNLMQSFTETIFFFNPCLLWLSSLMRDERENCCDDIAIMESGCRNTFVHAIVFFQEQHLFYVPTAPGFAGKKKKLFNRVKRIVSQTNNSLNVMEHMLLIAVLLTTGIIMAAFTKSGKELPQKAMPVAVDTIPVKQSMKTTPYTEADRVTGTVVNGVLTEKAPVYKPAAPETPRYDSPYTAVAPEYKPSPTSGYTPSYEPYVPPAHIDSLKGTRRY